MEIKELREIPEIDQDKKLNKVYTNFSKLLSELNTKALSEETVQTISQCVDQINDLPDSKKELIKQIRKTQARVLKLIEKKHKIVAKNHYQNMWMALGMSVFGVPLGVAFGASIGNMAFLGTGLPIGMVIGLAVGKGMDKKASQEGRQIDLEL